MPLGMPFSQKVWLNSSSTTCTDQTTRYYGVYFVCIFNSSCQEKYFNIKSTPVSYSQCPSCTNRRHYWTLSEPEPKMWLRGHSPLCSAWIAATARQMTEIFSLSLSPVESCCSSWCNTSCSCCLNCLSLPTSGWTEEQHFFYSKAQNQPDSSLLWCFQDTALLSKPIYRITNSGVISV